MAACSSTARACSVSPAAQWYRAAQMTSVPVCTASGGVRRRACSQSSPATRSRRAPARALAARSRTPGHLAVGTLRRERQEARALVLVRDDRGQPPVQRSPAQRVDGLVGRRGEQRMREAQAVPSSSRTCATKAGRSGSSPPASAVTSGNVGCESAAVAASTSRVAAGSAAIRPATSSAPAAPGAEASARGEQRSLPVEAGQPPARRTDSHQRRRAPAAARAEGRPAQATIQQVMHIFELQRPNGHPRSGSRPTRALGTGSAVRRASSTPDRFALSRRQRKASTAAEAAVEPLHVVDRDQHGAGRQAPARRRAATAHDTLVQRCAPPLEQEGDAQRLGLRQREDVEDLVEHAGEKIAQAGEREPRLGGRGLRGEHLVPALAREFQPGGP